jgi:predicted nuclease of predicted toxin-antitoxin system
VWVDVEALIEASPPTTRETRQVLDYRARGAKARFYADENFPSVAVSMLRKMGARVRTAREAGLTGHSDENHVAYALREGLILLSRDRDFLNEKRFPLICCPAIFVFDFGSGTAAEMKHAFRSLACVFSTPQFFDKWWKIDARRDCWTESVRYQNGTTSRHRYRVWQDKLQEWVP